MNSQLFATQQNKFILNTENSPVVRWPCKLLYHSWLRRTFLWFCKLTPFCESFQENKQNEIPDIWIIRLQKKNNTYIWAVGFLKQKCEMSVTILCVLLRALHSCAHLACCNGRRISESSSPFQDNWKTVLKAEQQLKNKHIFSFISGLGTATLKISEILPLPIKKNELQAVMIMCHSQKHSYLLAIFWKGYLLSIKWQVLLIIMMMISVQ